MLFFIDNKYLYNEVQLSAGEDEKCRLNVDTLKMLFLMKLRPEEQFMTITKKTTKMRVSMSVKNFIIINHTPKVTSD
jgi:hypothetical protein